MKRQVNTLALALFTCSALFLSASSTITRDSFGMPIITAGTTQDIAESIGYVQAQDRLSQIFLTVQVANGRGAQYFGSDLLESDILQHQLNYTDSEVQSQIDTLFTEKIKPFYDSYVVGLNKYVMQVNQNRALMPYELSSIGFKRGTPIPLFTVYDIIRTNQFILQQFSPSSIPSYQLQNQADLEVLTQAFGASNALNIFNDIDPTSKQIKSPYTIVSGSVETFPIIKQSAITVTEAHLEIETQAQLYAEKFQRIKKLYNKSGIPTTGSNGQAIGAVKSDSGNPMIRIAPQPNFNHPSDFYQTRIEGNQVGLTCNYFTIPTLPFAPIGVFNRFGIGVQVGHLPSNDFLYEPKANAQYVRTDTIQVSGEKSIQLPIYRSTSGGFVITNPINDSTSTILTLRSVFMGKQLQALNAFIEVAFANTLTDLQNTLLNPAWQSDIMLLEGNYVDHNNIAVFHTGGWTKLADQYDRRLPQGTATNSTPTNTIYSYNNIVHSPLFDENSPQGFYCGWNSLFKQNAAGSSDTVSPIGVNRMYWLEQYILSFNKLTYDNLKDIGKNQYLANSNMPFVNDDLDFDADLFSILFKNRFFQAVQHLPSASRLQAISLLQNFQGNWFDGDITNTPNVSDQMILASVWLNAVANTVLNPYLANTSRLIATGTVTDPAPSYTSFGDSNSLIDAANLLSRIFHIANDNKLFFNGWLNNQPSIDTIIVNALDFALDILGPQPWGQGKRGIYQFNNPIIGPVQSMFVGNVSGCIMVAEFTPTEIIMESILALGQSGEVLGKKNNLIYNPHSFDQQPLFSQLDLRSNPPFLLSQ